jgi:hypothetical protein
MSITGKCTGFASGATLFVVTLLVFASLLLDLCDCLVPDAGSGQESK